MHVELYIVCMRVLYQVSVHVKEDLRKDVFGNMGKEFRKSCTLNHLFVLQIIMTDQSDYV